MASVVTERLKRLFEKHGDSITPCFISMLLYGIEHLDTFEPCCECCPSHAELYALDNVWCTDVDFIYAII